MGEVIERCPRCECENVLASWDVTKQGFLVRCWNCGYPLLLCDECKHAADNPTGRCDWHGTIINGRTKGKCFRMEVRK